MAELISHKGRVVSADTEKVSVEIVSESACAACHAAGLCGMSEYTEKAIQVPADRHAAYRVGDEVDVVLEATMGMKAVFLAYFFPLLILLAVALGLIGLGVHELWAGLAGIAAVGLWYLVIWLLRDRLRNEYVFTIHTK